MEYKEWLEDEKDKYTVILDAEDKEKALSTVDQEPWDLGDRLFKEWQDKKDLSQKA